MSSHSFDVTRIQELTELLENVSYPEAFDTILGNVRTWRTYSPLRRCPDMAHIVPFAAISRGGACPPLLDDIRTLPTCPYLQERPEMAHIFPASAGVVIAKETKHSLISKDDPAHHPD